VTASVRLSVPTAEGMRRLGERLAGLLRAGDLVLLTGDLGAGKTTLAQGVGAGLGVRGDVTSPTFVIAREHRSAGGGPDLVHVDAYRLGSLAEVDDLDLDAAVEESVTVVEWGSGLVEDLAASRLEVRLERLRGAAGDAEGGGPGGDGAADETRTVEVAGHGPRWAGVALDALAPGAG
jgi:tRNA threonylcarbamoyladenosine biosynthesis protein TsaE